ncbi:MAG: hypothetical protein ABIS92_08215 [Polyangia bacterium]
MIKESSDSLSLATTALTDRLERNPYAVVAAAVGVGYVLGGGLFTRLTARIVGTALRMGITATLPFLKEELLVAVMQDFKGTAPPEGVEDTDPPAKGHARKSRSA